MSKYKVILVQYNTEVTDVAECDTIDQCWESIFYFLESIKYKSYYQRYWIAEGHAEIDYGSYSSFFHIYKTDGSDMTIEDLRREVIMYPCIKNGHKECDSCGECQEKGLFTCENCDCQIFEGDEYYEIGGQILCEDCVRDIYGRFA